MVNQTEIKKRDRWRCKNCSHKFSVHAYPFTFDGHDNSDNWITLCSSCWEDLFINKPRESMSGSIDLCRRLLKTNKIVLIGDCHGRFEELDKIFTAEEPFDFFLSVGDVGSLSDAALVRNIEIIDKWGSRGWFVRGNHDVCTFFHNLGLHQEINGIHVAGLNGTVKSRNFMFNNNPNYISFNEVLYLTHLNDIDILVTHPAPTGIFKNKGEMVLTEVLNYMVPKIYVFGHIHDFKMKYLLQTFCISLPLVSKGYAVAHFQGRDLRNLEIVLRRGKKTIRV